MRWKEETGASRRGKNWMSAMGILFIVIAAIVTVRNFLLLNLQSSAGIIQDGTQQFLNNFINGQITNEKFVIAMLAVGAFLLYWGYFKKKEDRGPPDEHDWRRSYR
jgi:ABC-type phosphate transport system permease subunit